MAGASGGSLLEIQNPRSQPRPKDLHFTKIPRCLGHPLQLEKHRSSWHAKRSPLAQMLFLSFALSDLQRQPQKRFLG